MIGRCLTGFLGPGWLLLLVGRVTHRATCFPGKVPRYPGVRYKMKYKIFSKINYKMVSKMKCSIVYKMNYNMVFKMKYKIVSKMNYKMKCKIVYMMKCLPRSGGESPQEM